MCIYNLCFRLTLMLINVLCFLIFMVHLLSTKVTYVYERNVTAMVDNLLLDPGLNDPANARLMRQVSDYHSSLQDQVYQHA